MKIAVIGSGYVGLVAGACFADTGNDVWSVDNNASKIDALKRGEIPIYEPGLETLVKRGMEHKRLHFTTSIDEAVRNCEIIFMAVGTPSLPSGEPDLSFLQQAAESVGRAMNGPKLVVNKSTVPVGAHIQVAGWIKKHSKHPVEVVSNPEFLKEGSALDDFLKPDRVVIGTHSREAYEKMAEIYAPFVRQGNPILWMDPVSAEITKYASNSFLATRISFMNELAQFCERVGGDIELVRKGMITDVRIGKHFLYAGAGYGGSCFPKDVKALIAKAESVDLKLGIIQAAEDANERQKRHVFHQVIKHFGGKVSGMTFAVWGLAFKPNTDDLREAPALVVIDELIKAGANIRAYDPVAMPHARELLNPKVTLCEDAYGAAKGADAVLLITEWNEFRHADLDQVRAGMKQAVFFDGRNIFEPETVKKHGFTYYGIGRR